jgi:hypothetical protein
MTGEKATKSDREHPKPAGKHAQDVLGDNGTRQMMSSLHDTKGESKLAAWASAMMPSLKYSTVSELNGTDSAFCGIFFE